MGALATKTVGLRGSGDSEELFAWPNAGTARPSAYSKSWSTGLSAPYRGRVVAMHPAIGSLSDC